MPASVRVVAPISANRTCELLRDADKVRNGSYPLSRRLFVSHLNAFVVGDEALLLACFLDRQYTDPRITSASLVTFTDGAEAAYQVDQVCH